MRSVALLAPVVVLAVACGGKDPIARVCDKVATHCGLDADGVTACKGDMAGVEADVARKMAACGGDGCPALLACFAEAAGAGAVDGVIGGFEKGFEEGIGNPRYDPECADFEPPKADCTKPDRSCEWDRDCPDGRACNKELKRCFDPDGACVGSRCKADSSCAKGERCNKRTDTCFRPDASQHCMPCVIDSDCGPGRCVGNTCSKPEKP